MRCLGLRTVTVAVVAVLALAASSCGGGGGLRSPGTIGGGSTQLTVNIGDHPSDRIVSLEITVTNLALNPTAGAPVVLISSPVEVELGHLAGALRLLARQNIPQGTYSSATITISKVEVKFIALDGSIVEKQDTQARTVTFNFANAVTVGSTPMVFNLDLNVVSSIVINTNGNTIVWTPQFNHSFLPIGSPAQQHFMNGELDHIMGIVTAVGQNSFTIRHGFSRVDLTFQTDASTEFDGLAGLGGLHVNDLVKVEGKIQGNGSLLAEEVELLSTFADGMEVEGFVTHGDATPPTDSFQMIIHAGAGMAMMGSTSNIGLGITANVGAGANYKIDNDADLSGLPFDPQATFTRDAGAPFSGQRVEVETTWSPGMMLGQTITANEVKLEEQPLIGTISNLSLTSGRGTFTLNLAPDSFLAQVYQTTTVTVYVQGQNTELHDGLNLAMTTTPVVVRGVLLRSNNGWHMVATRIVGRP